MIKKPELILIFTNWKKNSSNGIGHVISLCKDIKTVINGKNIKYKEENIKYEEILSEKTEIEDYNTKLKKTQVYFRQLYLSRQNVQKNIMISPEEIDKLERTKKNKIKITKHKKKVKKVVEQEDNDKILQIETFD